MNVKVGLMSGGDGPLFSETEAFVEEGDDIEADGDDHTGALSLDCRNRAAAVRVTFLVDGDELRAAAAICKCLGTHEVCPAGTLTALRALVTAHDTAGATRRAAIAMTLEAGRAILDAAAEKAAPDA